MTWKRYNCWDGAQWPGAEECREAERKAVRSYWARTRAAQEDFARLRQAEGLGALAILEAMREEWPKHPASSLRSRMRSAGVLIQRYAGWPELWDSETSALVKQWMDSSIVEAIYRDKVVELDTCAAHCRRWMRQNGHGHLNEVINNRGLAAAIRSEGWTVKRRSVGMVIVRAKLVSNY